MERDRRQVFHRRERPSHVTSQPNHRPPYRRPNPKSHSRNQFHSPSSTFRKRRKLEFNRNAPTAPLSPVPSSSRREQNSNILSPVPSSSRREQDSHRTPTPRRTTGGVNETDPDSDDKDDLKDRALEEIRTGNTPQIQPLVDLKAERLDPSDPVHARRIQQRKRQISMGKNTVGYDEYIKQVPKNSRKKFSMEHPVTPDVMADVPTRRFQGIVNAWKRALHRYDPPDLVEKSIYAPDDDIVKDLTESATKLLKCEDSVQAREIADATARGLQVDFGPEFSEMETQSTVEDCAESVNQTPMNHTIGTPGRWGDEGDSSDDDLL